MTGSSTAQGSRDMMKTALRFTVVARGVGLGSVSWARRCLATLALLIVIVAAGCGWEPFFPPSVSFTFENRTDAALCEYGSPEGAAAARCLQELKPRAETESGRDCDGLEDRPITVIITVKQGGSTIYDKTATCGEWHDSGGRFVIEQEADEFIVTDSLPDSTPSP